MRIELNRVLLLALCMAVLPACSGGGPTDDEMKAAFLLFLQPTVGQGATFQSFENRGCKPEGEVYRCKLSGVLAYTFKFGDVEQEKTQPLVGSYNFIQTEQGWRLVR